MVAETHGRRWIADDYLILERSSPVKHEYVDGIVYALTGGTRAHSRIVSNAALLLEEALDNSPCQVFTSDMKVRITARLYRYPDLSVSCDPRDDNLEDEELDYVMFPRLILETLADSTAREDRTTKFAEYSSLPSLRKYLLVASDRMHVQIHHREGDSWSATEYGADDVITLESLGVSLKVSALYHKIRLRPALSS